MLNVEFKIDEEDQVIILLSSLPKSYESLMTILLVGNSMLTIDEVCTALLEIDNMN